MADMNDLAQQIAFYQAGGKDPGTSSLDKVNSGLDAIGSIVKDVLATKKSKLDAEKSRQETSKLKIENTPAMDAYGTPVIKSDISTAQAAPIPTADLASGVLNSRGAALDTIAQKSRDMGSKFGNLTVGQYKDMAEANKAANPVENKEDLYPASKIMVFADAKKVLPDLTPEQYVGMTYGSLKQQIAAGKQSDLNNNRNQVRDASRDNMVLNLRKSMETNPFLNKLREQNLGLDTTADIEKLVASGNTVGAAALGIKEAKGLGEVGVMTDRDVTRYITSKQIGQKAGDILLSWLRGTPTQATQEEVMQINGVIKDRLTSRINDEYGQYVDLLANNFDITRDEAARRLAIKLPQGQPLGEVASSQPAAPDAITKSIQSQLPPGAKIKSIRRLP